MARVDGVACGGRSRAPSTSCAGSRAGAGCAGRASASGPGP